MGSRNVARHTEPCQRLTMTSSSWRCHETSMRLPSSLASENHCRRTASARGWGTAFIMSPRGGAAPGEITLQTCYEVAPHSTQGATEDDLKADGFTTST